MKFNANQAIRDVLDFLLTYWKPSQAKYIIWPSMSVGLASLSVPLWIDVANWILEHQTFFPGYQSSIIEPNYPLGASLIGLSVIVFFLDTWLKKNSLSKDQLQDLSSDVAKKITAHMKESGITAQHLQDECIEKQINEITLLRFFGGFPKEEKAVNLANAIIDGELSGGAPQVKARTLALLARYLCVGDSSDQAKQWLSTSSKICQTKEAAIAQMFFDAISSGNTDTVSVLLKESMPLNFSAFFTIKKIVEGNSAAVCWFDQAELSVRDLDGDGKVALVSALLADHQWEKALTKIDGIDKESISQSAALAQLAAFVLIVNAIKVEELRSNVMNCVPLAADRFPLADDSNSIELRNRSAEMFKLCSQLAGELGAGYVANIADQYALWLELRNNEKHFKAKERLQAYFDDYTQKTLEYLPLAFAFGVDIDYEAIEKEINKQTALSHVDNPILGLARFVVAQAKQSFKEVLEYISVHRTQMESAVNATSINMLEVEALARSGLVDDAEKLLKKVEDCGAVGTEVKNLRNIIEAAKGKDPIALAISQYQESRNTDDLSYLVSLLERGEFKDKYFSYCRELFERTGQESDAIRVCNSASLLGRFSELHQFLLDRMDLVNNNVGLQSHWAWSLFRKGELNEAQKQIDRLKQSGSQNVDLKTLEINLSILSGDWETLSVFVEERWKKREDLKTDELLQAAQLAKAVSPGRAKQLLEFCTRKFSQDPQVLATAYFTATTMGWEDNRETSEWLNKAILLSNEDGPLHTASFEDVTEMMSDARERNDRVYQAYFDGDAPIFTVAELLNRTMSDFFLVSPLENKKTKDIRKKNLVPIFHGVRPEKIITGKTIAIDSSCALVMGNIGLLGPLFDCVEKIIIPHSFMRWLFEEKQKVAFHQPSQIEKARYFESLISDARLFVFHPKKINNPGLALDVGDELAFMLEEVNETPTNESQGLVICSYPVYKASGSFRETEVDLSSFHHCLISCSQLIRHIEAQGVITATQSVQAINYLSQYEREWPNDVDVVRGTKLFIDSLSITYLMTVDMLDKITEAGFEVYVFKGERNRYRSLISYDSIIKQADLIIEGIRGKIFSGIASGKVALAEMSITKEKMSSPKSSLSLPTEDLFAALNVCDGALIDDRFLNRHRDVASGHGTVPIFTSLDFIETLYHKEQISFDQKLDYRTKLRELGYQFINFTSEELEFHLNHSALVDGELQPTKQLSLLKECFLMIRISGLVQLPRDAQWLHEALKIISKSIPAQWSEGISLEESKARSCWLYELLGYREWAQLHEIRGNEGIAFLGGMLKVNSILIAPESLPVERKEAYSAWLDEFVLAPLQDNDPWSYQHVVDSMKQQLKSVSSHVPLEELSE
jgi:hypothetical protein